MPRPKHYRRGVKDFLASFVVGETKPCDTTLLYESVKQTASRMKRDYGCVYQFNGYLITRIQ